LENRGRDTRAAHCSLARKGSQPPRSGEGKEKEFCYRPKEDSRFIDVKKFNSMKNRKMNGTGDNVRRG